MDEGRLREAIEHSGYPLQTVVAGTLVDREYRIDEEWGWLDPDREAERTLDIVAERTSGYWNRTDRGAVLPICSLLVECKQSRNPYLGFSSVSPPSLDRHPPIVGLSRPNITLNSPSGDRTLQMALIHLLGLRAHSYLRDPLLISSISRAHPQSKRIEISGEEPFNSLVKPLTKASRRFREHWSDPNPGIRDALEVRLVFPIAVIDAPLLAVSGRQGSSELTAVDWMRVISRHAAGPDRRRRSPLGFEVVDLVAADYFERFLADHLHPFFNDFFLAMAKMQDIVLSGRAVIDDYTFGNPLPFDFRDRLRSF